MATITFKVWDSGVLTDAVSVVLSDNAGAYGIKRTATGVVVVAAGTAFTKTATGVYQYTFTPLERMVSYTGWVKVVTSAGTDYYEIVYTPPTEVLETGNTPSSVLAKYLIDTLGVFVNQGDSGEWPLYKTSLPDGSGIVFEAASIHDTTPVVDAKAMDGTYNQAHGIQIHVRSKLYETGYCKLAGVVKTLATVHGITVTMADGNRYEIVNVSVASDAVYIGPDEKKRVHFTANLLLKLKSL
jgi:hypothetical protein